MKNPDFDAYVDGAISLVVYVARYIYLKDVEATLREAKRHLWKVENCG